MHSFPQFTRSPYLGNFARMGAIIFRGNFMVWGTFFIGANFLGEQLGGGQFSLVAIVRGAIMEGTIIQGAVIRGQLSGGGAVFPREQLSKNLLNEESHDLQLLALKW